MESVTLEVEEFHCPRCSETVRERLYGPCASCREDLGIRLRSEGGEAATPSAYVPKMNVVPNQVATKD